MGILLILKKWISPRGGGSDNVDKVFVVEFRHFLMLFGYFIAYLVVFSLYLAITVGSKSKKGKQKKKKKYYTF